MGPPLKHVPAAAAAVQNAAQVLDEWRSLSQPQGVPVLMEQLRVKTCGRPFTEMSTQLFVVSQVGGGPVAACRHSLPRA
jgi:hypothetical protein